VRPRKPKRPVRTYAGEHDVCDRCDLFVHPEHRGQCPGCGAKASKCEGPFADRRGPLPGCVGCYHGEQRAQQIARRLGGVRFATLAELITKLEWLAARLGKVSSPAAFMKGEK
jgi:hypothetical protein